MVYSPRCGRLFSPGRWERPHQHLGGQKKGTAALLCKRLWVLAYGHGVNYSITGRQRPPNHSQIVSSQKYGQHSMYALARTYIAAPACGQSFQDASYYLFFFTAGTAVVTWHCHWPSWQCHRLLSRHTAAAFHIMIFCLVCFHGSFT